MADPVSLSRLFEPRVPAALAAVLRLLAAAHTRASHWVDRYFFKLTSLHTAILADAGMNARQMGGHYWLLRYQEAPGLTWETTTRILAVHPDGKRISVWCHRTRPSLSHERDLDIANIASVFDLTSNRAIDVLQWLDSLEARMLAAPVKVPSPAF